MSTKVLVFESDREFANELVLELGKLDCEVKVVDDGNVGLQMAASDRPDLVLLSIELPRMNGFSVCNKLKKDPLLKDVPLVIMSSESSDETFEQHRKLRTRAEDYVHKPIAFADLLDRIRPLVPIGSGEGLEPMEDAIVIDDEIAFDDGSQEAGMVVNEHFDTVPPSNAPAPFEGGVDPDVDRFADDAFDRLMDAPAPAGPEAADLAPPPVPRSVLPPAHSARPAAVVDTVEIDRVRAELERSRAELDQVRGELARHRTDVGRLERELVSAQSEAQRLQDDNARLVEAESEVERLQRLVDELKAKGSGATRAGGVSSREFLDLREALNKKDKEILALRDQSSHKERDIIEARDASLSLEREKADLNDKMLAFEQELLDVRGSLESSQAESQAKQSKLDALAKSHTAELAARDAKASAAAKAAEEALSALRAELQAAHERALGEQREQLDGERSQALSRARDEAASALAAREAELEAAHAELVRKLEQDRDQRISGLEAELASSRQSLASTKEAMQASEADRDRRIAELEGELAQTFEQLSNTREEKQKSESDRDARIASLEGDLSSLRDELSSTQQAKQKLEAELQSTRDELSSTQQAKLQSESDRDARIASLEGDLSSARDQLSSSQEAKQKLEAELQSTRDELSSTQQAKQQSESDRDARISAMEAQLSSSRDQLAALEAAKAQSESERDARIASLEADKATLGTERDNLQNENTSLLADLAQVRARSTELEGSLRTTSEKLAQVESSLAAQVLATRRAHDKWEQDKACLERAKDALAAALVQIEEAEARPVD